MAQVTNPNTTNTRPLAELVAMPIDIARLKEFGQHPNHVVSGPC
jgi:hypothetical protein